MSINLDLMEKGELQRMCVELFKQFEDFKIIAFIIYKDLKILKLKKMCLLKKLSL
jgi:hypothetical protein